MKYRVKIYCFGMVAENPKEFDTEEAAEQYAAEMQRIPGFIPIVEEVES
ncbi:hypothetical protein [Streptomyces sp. MP131-18]|nr:hypothetical protein [Streptomyces sp. MP131-18]ONK10339.1 hypothetical protein STBA_10610 [Streptomyces sp. MP131-18]